MTDGVSVDNQELSERLDRLIKLFAGFVVAEMGSPAEHKAALRWQLLKLMADRGVELKLESMDRLRQSVAVFHDLP